MRRVISLWLPHWQTDVAQRRSQTSAAPAEPFALVVVAAGTERLAATSRTAETAGLRPGMTLTDARALLPSLATAPAAPMAAMHALEALADWALRFSPWVAICGTDALWFDISGCAHLFGGEETLLNRLLAGVRHYYDARAALADSPGAAWAVARFGKGGVVAHSEAETALAAFPVAALRLDRETAAGLTRIGLGHIGDLCHLPRAPLVARFGEVLTHRLDQALGRIHEPISPRRPPATHEARRAFAEPIADATLLAATMDALLTELCADLARAGRGVRRLVATVFRIDGTATGLRVGTSRASRDKATLTRLLAEKLDGLDTSPGIEVVTLAASTSDPLPACQGDLAGAYDSDDLATLVDRLTNRLGTNAVMRLTPRASHYPERTVIRRAALDTVHATWPPHQRPVRLFEPPLAIEAVAAVPDGSPMLFRWHGQVFQVARASGPERIADEWWHENAPLRDYYRVEDITGARFWLYREGPYNHPAAPVPRWYLHGVFG